MVTATYSFTSGTLINSTQFNTNFDDLVNGTINLRTDTDSVSFGTYSPIIRAYYYDDGSVPYYDLAYSSVSGYYCRAGKLMHCCGTVSGDGTISFVSSSDSLCCYAPQRAYIVDSVHGSGYLINASSVVVPFAICVSVNFGGTTSLSEFRFYNQQTGNRIGPSHMPTGYNVLAYSCTYILA